MLSEVILAQLKQSGKITDKDIEEIEDNLMDAGKISCINRLHLLFCMKNHDEGECPWYVEEQMHDTWNQQMHKEWKEKITSLRKSLYVNWPILDIISVSLAAMPVPFDILLPALSSHFLNLGNE